MLGKDEPHDSVYRRWPYMAMGSVREEIPEFEPLTLGTGSGE